jgi:hypothetical protein
MMTVDEELKQELDDLFKRMNKAYDDIVDLLDRDGLDREEAFSLLAQILCQLSHDDKDEFIRKMDKYFSIERFLRPKPTEVH